MDVVKISLLAIAIVFAITFTKQIKPELSVIITVAGSVVMLVYILGYFNNIVVFYNELVVKTGVDQQYFTILLKAIGIGFVVVIVLGLIVSNKNRRTV
jgi:hypothetical protein